MPAILSPSAKQQFFTNGSEVAAGYRLYIYAANTLTPQTTFVDRDGSVPNTNPIILDARGEATIYLTPGIVHDYVLKTDLDADVWTREDVIADAGDANAVAFIQAGTGAIVRSSQDKLRERVSVKDYGAVGDGSTDDTAEIQAAIDSCIARGIATLHFPSGNYKISAELSITQPLWLVGEGVKLTIIRQTSPTANGVNFNYPSLRPGGGVKDLTIESGAGWHTAGYQGAGSSGSGLVVSKVLGSFQARDVAVHNFTIGVFHNLSWGTLFQNVDVLYFNNTGVRIDGSVAAGGNGDNRWHRVTCHNNGYSGDASSSVGFLILHTGHEQFTGCDAVKTATGWMFRPDNAAKQVSYVFMDSCLADSSFQNGFDFDGGVGGVVSIQCHNCWASGCVTHGVVTRTNVFEIMWVGGRMRENGAAGWAILGGQDIQIVGAMINSNSQFNANVYPGVLVGAGATKWGVIGCRIGNAASALNNQAHGIEIQVGASDLFRIVGNDLSNYGAGKLAISNGAAGSNYVIADNIPVGVEGANELRGSTQALCTNGTVAAGTTTYLGPNGQFASELDSFMMTGRAGRAARIQVNSDAPPGAGQSFTYILRRGGGVDTAMQVVTTDSTSAAFTIANQQNLNSNDLWTVKLVTSAGAAVTRHRVTVSIDPG